jgi:hypothetical protein
MTNRAKGGQHQDYAGPSHWTTTGYQAVGHPVHAATVTIGCGAVQSSNATWPPATPLGGTATDVIP